MLQRAGFEVTTLVMIGSDFIGTCKFNYHTTTTAPDNVRKNQTYLTLFQLLINKKIFVNKREHIGMVRFNCNGMYQNRCI
jgi:hypothetical protein